MDPKYYKHAMTANNALA